MSFSRYFKLATTLLILSAGTSIAANSGKIRFSTGEAHLFRNGVDHLIVGDLSKPELSALKKAKKTVKPKDNIRTMVESQVIIALPDGSKYSIEENTDITINTISFENGERKFETTVNNGRLGFEAQKMASTKSTFKFKTGTATAAIRGTEGIIGLIKGRFLASLRNGKLEIQGADNKLYTINGGQTLFFGADSATILDLQNSGNAELFNRLEKALSDSTIQLDSLVQIFSALDSQLTAQLSEFVDANKCKLLQYPDTIYDNKVTIPASCPEGVMLEMGGDTVRNDKSIELGWETSAFGPKSFEATCYATIPDVQQQLRYSCGKASVFYKPKALDVDTSKTEAAPLTITTSSPLEVCSPAQATIEGTFDPNDTSATLTVSLGQYTSDNLIPKSANGQFSHTIPISDKIGNWNVSTATVTYKSSKHGNITKNIDISVNKTCKAVNLSPTTVTYNSYDSLKCEAYVSLSGAQDDITFFTVERDGLSGLSHSYRENQSIRVNLVEGQYDYTFTAKDQAGNKSTVKKKLGCYLHRSAQISIKGGPRERLRVPPPPSQYKSTFYRNLRFSVTGLPHNNPIFIKEIQINVPGKSTYTIKGTDITSNQIDYQLELNRSKKPIDIGIKVILKNGVILNATKTYEVR